MTKEECIALLNRYAEYNGIGIPNLAGCREAMRMAAKLLSQPSLPSVLDEAAEEALDDFDANWQIDERNDGCTEPGYNQKQMLLMFKAGAEWMAGQGVNADFGVCKLVNRAWLTPIDGKKFEQGICDNFSAGDKVIVQIRKK